MERDKIEDVHSFWDHTLLLARMILTAFAGCGRATSSNDEPIDQGEDDGDYIDWDSLYLSQRGFQDGQALK